MGKVKIGNFKGPQGETGPQGPAGPQGPEGPQGPMGEVDANTQIVFTQATNRENIASGEKLNIILGKIRKWFADIRGAAFQDVSNTLTTTEAGKVLDARQGKVLDGKVAKKLDKTDVVNGLTETAEGKALDARQGKVLEEKIDNLSKEVSNLNSKLEGIKVTRKTYPMTLDPNSYTGGNVGTFQIPNEDIEKYGAIISVQFSGGSTAPGSAYVTYSTGAKEWWAYASCVDGTGTLTVQFLNINLDTII